MIFKGNLTKRTQLIGTLCYSSCKLQNDIFVCNKGKISFLSDLKNWTVIAMVLGNSVCTSLLLTHYNNMHFENI
jgi:hypothetical protein